MSPTLNKQASKERCAVEFATRKNPRLNERKAKPSLQRALLFLYIGYRKMPMDIKNEQTGLHTVKNPYRPVLC